MNEIEKIVDAMIVINKSLHVLREEVPSIGYAFSEEIKNPHETGERLKSLLNHARLHSAAIAKLTKQDCEILGLRYVGGKGN